MQAQLLELFPPSCVNFTLQSTRYIDTQCQDWYALPISWLRKLRLSTRISKVAKHEHIRLAFFLHFALCSRLTQVLQVSLEPQQPSPHGSKSCLSQSLL